MPGQTGITEIVAQGLQAELAWALVQAFIIFCLAWSFKGFAMDVLGWIWFQFSVFDVNVKICPNYTKGGQIYAVVEAVSLQTLTLRYRDMDNESFRRYIPMSEIKKESTDWLLVFPKVGRAV